jgi:hypothetical protein
MHCNDFFGYAAALAVLTSCCMSTIVSLRSVAIASNVLFILYGMLGHIYPVLLLHLMLLPINLIKLHQARLRLRQSAVCEGDDRSIWRESGQFNASPAAITASEDRKDRSRFGEPHVRAGWRNYPIVVSSGVAGVSRLSF